MLHVKISIDDGQGKKAELEIKEADQVQKVMIIQNVFNLFGIDTDVLEMARVYNEIGQAYKNFFDRLQPIDVEAVQVQDRNEIREKMIQGYQETAATNPAIEYTNTKERNGQTVYKLHYHCPACFNKGSRYVYITSHIATCHQCDHEMTIHSAHPGGFPQQDRYGNFYRAGDYMDRGLPWQTN